MGSILIIETSTDAASVALAVDGNIVMEKGFVSDRRHNALLFTPLAEIMEIHGSHSFDAVLVGSGPGSYSGTRVGIAAAQGAALAAGCKAIALPSILTTREAYSITYIGPPYVYSWQRVGDQCGLIGRRAITVIPNGAVWMGRGSFFIYQGGSVQPLPCDIGDYIFRLIVEQDYSLVHAYTNVKHKEAWWFFNLNNGLSLGSYYAAWNYENNTWTMGTMTRQAMHDGGVFDNPLGVLGESLYEHEVGYQYTTGLGSAPAPGGPWAVTGYFPIGDGSRFSRVRRIAPDGALPPGPGDPDDEETGELSILRREAVSENAQPDDWVSEPYDTTDDEFAARVSLWTDTSVRFAGRELALQVWNNINGRNLRENILPTRARANLILEKGADHRVERVLMRRL